MEMNELLKSTTPEQRENALQCKSAEELFQYAKSVDIAIDMEEAKEIFHLIHNGPVEVNDEDLDNIAGGKYSGDGAPEKCPKCNSPLLRPYVPSRTSWTPSFKTECMNCGNIF